MIQIAASAGSVIQPSVWQVFQKSKPSYRKSQATPATTLTPGRGNQRPARFASSNAVTMDQPRSNTRSAVIDGPTSVWARACTHTVPGGLKTYTSR